MTIFKTPVIIDCDPGIDDAFAIALANAADCIDIKAITAVEGNVPAEITRRNALSLRELFKIDCRIGFGATTPLEKEYNRTAADIHGKSGVGDWIFEEPKAAEDPLSAWDLIYDEAVKYKGKLVLFATGPLTNIAIALRKHPDLPQFIDKLIIMGGGTNGNMTPYAEFNIWIDPLAAKEVFQKMQVFMVGLDVTMASALGLGDLEEMIQICSESSSNSFLASLSRFCLQGTLNQGFTNNVLHDALAVASFTEPGIVTFKPARVSVVADADDPKDGQTRIDWSENMECNCQFGIQVDQPRFVRLMKNVCHFYNQH